MGWGGGFGVGTGTPLTNSKGDPIISIVNASQLTDNDITKVLPALEKQIDRDFYPLYGWRADLIFGDVKAAMKVVIRDREPAGGALGWHWKDGVPICEIFALDDLDYQGEWTSTLSHELCEMIANGGINLFALGPYKGTMAWWPFEVCDACEELVYRIDGVPVSDFLKPEWFEPAHAPGDMKMDFLGALDAPFTLTPGGYAQVLVDGQWQTIWGSRTSPTDQQRTRHRSQAIRAALPTDPKYAVPVS